MKFRLVIFAMALLSLAARAIAQESFDRSMTRAPGTAAATVRPPSPFRAVSLNAEPDRTEHSRFTIRPAPRLSNGVVMTQVPQKRSKAPVVGGMLLGAIAGFLGGNYIQRSVCEYDCGPGGFTWGFTAIGAAGGVGIGLLLR